MGEEVPPPVEQAQTPEEVQKPAEEVRKWYHHDGCFVTYEEFRETPMGRDILNGDEETREQELQTKWDELVTEEEHLRVGDCWGLQEMANNEVPFSLLSTFEKVEWCVHSFVKFCAVFGVLYLFIIALGLMGNAFKILGGRSSGRTFRDSDLIANPVAGLAIGILATVLMQSSSTTTSIVISMAASDLVSVENAAYLVMGANIGTSVTNTIVSIAHLNSPDEYRRAFTGAVFHDMFNWLTVGIFLPLEATSGFLMELAGAAVDSLNLSDEKREKTEFIKKITKPAEGRVVSVDKGLIEDIAAAQTSTEVKELEKKTIIKMKSGHVFRESPLTDAEIGVLLLFISLAMLTTCLLLLVKLLSSVLKGRVAVWTRYLLNLDFKHPVLRMCGGLDSYILLLFGTGVTILVQSSSVFTSTITPLVGIGLIHVEKMVPLTHGANIGTTVTGVLSALSSDNIDIGLRVALEHVFFNCLGTVIWFVIWPLRPVPLAMAKFMGETAANLRWFPLAYILFAFVAVPALVVGLSVAGWQVLVGVGVPLLVAALFFIVLVWARRNRADLLPRAGPLSVLRAEAAPCGCRFPNFMQLWGGDVDADRVDIAKLQAKEEEAARKRNSVAEWHYSPVAWGLTFLAFFGVLLATTTAQWRRVRYAQERFGRKEIGFGLQEVCSPQYESTHAYATPPPECNLEAVQQCAAELVQSCTADPAWSTGELTENENAQYWNTFERCSEFVGCRGYDWTRLCTALPACTGRKNHEANCWHPLRFDDWFYNRNAEAHGVTVHFHLSGVDERDALVLPHNNHFAEEAADEAKATAYPIDAPELSPALRSPAFGGLGFDPCTGKSYLLTNRGPTESCTDGSTVFTQPGYAPAFAEVTLARRMTSVETSWAVDFDATAAWTELTTPTVPVTGLPHTQHLQGSCANPVTSAGDLAGIGASNLRKLGATDTFATVDAYGSRIVIFSKDGALLKSLVPEGSPYTAANTGAPVESVLPRNFHVEGFTNGLGSLAVNLAGSKMFTCMKKSLEQDSRLVRCATLSLNGNAWELTAVRLVLMSDVAAGGIHTGVAQGSLEIAAASWFVDDKVLLLERVAGANSFDGSSLLEVNMAEGTDVGDLDTVEMAFDTTVPYVSVALASLATPVAVAPVTLKATSEELSGVVPVAVADIAVTNAVTVIMVEDKAWGTTEGGNIYAVTLAAELWGADDDEVERRQAAWDAVCPAGEKAVTPPMPGVRYETKCHQLNEICPEGDLGGDMAVIRGLSIAATLFMALTLPLVIAYSLVPYHPIVKWFIFVSAGTVTLSWIFCLAAWAHLVMITGNEYGCIFVDESLRGGLVLQRGELKWLTRDSYSWGFMVYAWGMLTFPLVAIWHRVVRLTCLPEEPKFGGEPEEDVIEHKIPSNEPVAA